MAMAHVVYQQAVSNRHITEIAQRIKRWQTLVDYLGITEAEVIEIKSDNASYLLEKIGFLKKWKTKNGDRATYHCLIEAAKKVSSEQHLVSFIAELLGNHLFSPIKCLTTFVYSCRHSRRW